MIRVLIADDNAILRRGLKEILLSEFEDVSCSEAWDAAHILHEVRSRAWDLVILEVNIRGQSGIDVIRNLKQLRPDLPVLVLSMHPDNQYGPRAFKAGATGYVSKDTAIEELLKAIRRLLAGGRYLSIALAERIALELSGPRPIHQTLSHREFEVLKMIVAGKTNSQIAEHLHLRTTTTSAYRARILKKMRMASNSELFRYALHNGLLD